MSQLIQAALYTAVVAAAIGLVLRQMAPGFKPPIALVIAAIVLIGAGVWWLMQASESTEAESSSLEGRVRGVAEMIRVEETPMRINKRPQVRLQLRVELPGKPPYEQELLALVPRGQAAQPGRKVWILVDPESKSDPILDWTTAPP